MRNGEFKTDCYHTVKYEMLTVKCNKKHSDIEVV